MAPRCRHHCASGGSRLTESSSASCATMKPLTLKIWRRCWRAPGTPIWRSPSSLVDGSAGGGRCPLRGAVFGPARRRTGDSRGTFDCLVRRPDGGVTVLELKTGKPMPEHERAAGHLPGGCPGTVPWRDCSRDTGVCPRRESGQSATRLEPSPTFCRSSARTASHGWRTSGRSHSPAGIRISAAWRLTPA